MSSILSGEDDLYPRPERTSIFHMNNGRVIEAMQRKFDDLQSLYNDAVEDNRKWAEWASVSRCIYCDAEFHHDPHNQERADELKKAHILVCEKHPYGILLRALKMRSPFYAGSKYLHFDQCEKSLDTFQPKECNCGADVINQALRGGPMIASEGKPED